MILSPNWIVVEFTAVVVPATVKLPAILTFEPVNWIAVLNELVNEFKDADELFKAATEIFKLALVLSKLVNLPKVEPLNDSNEVILALWVVNVCATEELKSPVTDATDADNEVILALLAENEVATEELKSPVTDATDADKAVWEAWLALNEVATDALKLLMLPVKSGISFLSEPSKYKVELPLA